MIIWLALVLPLLSAALLYWKFHHRIEWWEAGLQLGVPIILIAATKACVETSQTSDTEFWGGHITHSAYYEAWNEKVSCRHPIPCSHPKYTTDEKGRRVRDGNQHWNDGHYHAFDVDDHDPYWEIYSSLGGDYTISQAEFESYAVRWKNRAFEELNRTFHTKDGNMYKAVWDQKPETIQAVTASHTYENRIQASKSVFNFQIVDPKDFGLFEYPAISGLYQPAVLGDGIPVEACRKLDYLNATLGAPKQVRIYVLLFRGKPMQAAMDQESYWKGGNKNEFVTAIGLGKENDVQWCHVFSWTEVDILKVEARNFIMGQKTLDLGAYAEWLGPAIREKWVRKPFKDFSYLTVDPPMSAVIWTFIVTFLVSAGLSAWVILNELHLGGEGHPGFGRYAKSVLKVEEKR